MVFSSIFFIFTFLPIFLLIYYLIPNKYRNIVLLIGSVFFYSWGEPVYIILMFFSCLFNYYMALEIESSDPDSSLGKFNVIFTVIINIFILGFFKYQGFLLDTINSIFRTSISHPSLSLPIGISFYTFKNLSYIFDVRKRKTRAQRNLLHFAVYTTMFPHMAAGPIVRYVDIEEQLVKRPISLAKLGVGAELFIKGLSKKVLLADNLALVYTQISSLGEETSVVCAWFGILAYAFQIYFDFSGYSDMAIGIGKMLGFDFQKNFDYPYTSTSVSEFWRRWHISLGSWFRDYIYIPLGGNRVSTKLHIRNILIVWTLTGLWHGASWNFVFWGLFYGIILLLEKFLLLPYLNRIPAFLANCYTMIIVLIGWVFFSQTNFISMGHYLGYLFGIGANGFIDSTAIYLIRTNLVLMILAAIICRPSAYQVFKSNMKYHPKATIGINIGLLLLCIAYMVYNSFTPFLYANF